jgi:hypothetical protein
MKKCLLLSALIVFLVACAPAPEAIQTAIAETQTVWTPVPTATFYPTYTFYPTFTPLPSPTFTPTPSADGSAVAAAFKAAGLEADSVHPLTREEYKLAPYVCTGTRFLIPSLGPETGGRIFVCPNQEDLALLSDFYTEMGRASAMLSSWLFPKGLVLVQITGELPDAKARQYEAAIP